MVKFPMKFEVQTIAGAGIQSPWKAQAGNLPPIPCAIPPECMGPGGAYSPEDLFALALLSCLIGTFKVGCEKAGISFKEIRCRAELTADKNPSESCFWMAHADVFIDILGASDAEMVKKILDSTIKNCAVCNSIKTGKTFHLSIA